MEILSIHPKTKQGIYGRMSDGSDRQIVTITRYIAEVKHDNRRYQLAFDHEPTEQEIADAIAAGEYEDITTEADQMDYIIEKLAAIETATTVKSK